MQWSHNDVWMVTGDHAGYIKYWQSNMNNVKMFQVGLMIAMLSKKLLTKVDLTHLNKIFAGINPLFRLTKRRSGESRSVPLTPSSPPAVTMAL